MYLKGVMILIYVIIFYIIFFMLSKKKLLYRNDILCYKKNDISVLTYNIKKLPNILNNLNYDNWDYDIICLQECFSNLFLLKEIFLNKTKKYNFISPSSDIKYLIDSGLVILSKFPIKYIGFETFKKKCSVDSLAEKGFLIVIIKDMIVINTHLQCCYENNDNEQKNIQYLQLQQIKEYIIENNLTNINILLVGDFNMNIFDINLFENFSKIYHKNPTTWCYNNGILSEGSATKLYKNQIPYWIDGGFLQSNNYKINNINTICLDNNTDHLGVSFKLN